MGCLVEARNERGKATDDWSSFMHSTTNSPEPDIITGADDERAPTTTKPAGRPLRPKSPLPKQAGKDSCQLFVYLKCSYRILLRHP